MSVTIELKHDGTTEYFTVEDKAFNYWNRTSGVVNLSWKKLESAKIYIENSDSKADYYVDEMSFSKKLDNTENTKLQSYKPMFYIGFICVLAVGLIVGLKKFKA